MKMNIFTNSLAAFKKSQLYILKSDDGRPHTLKKINKTKSLVLFLNFQISYFSLLDSFSTTNKTTPA